MTLIPVPAERSACSSQDRGLDWLGGKQRGQLRVPLAMCYASAIEGGYSKQKEVEPIQLAHAVTNGIN